MEKHSISINIFGRQFPAVVDEDEAAVIREAADTINAKIKAFKAQYPTQDDLDIAIMCCLETMTTYLSQQAKDEKQKTAALAELAELEQKLNKSLQMSDVN
ncbi:MAG: cell division protein ZapA [Bacteroidota bacterium]